MTTVLRVSTHSDGNLSNHKIISPHAVYVYMYQWATPIGNQSHNSSKQRDIL